MLSRARRPRLVGLLPQAQHLIPSIEGDVLDMTKELQSCIALTLLYGPGILSRYGFFEKKTRNRREIDGIVHVMSLFGNSASVSPTTDIVNNLFFVFVGLFCSVSVFINIPWGLSFFYLLSLFLLLFFLS